MRPYDVIEWLRPSLRCFVLIALVGSPAGAATNIVRNLADSGAGSLRQAIVDASSNDAVIFSTNGTITLTTGELVLEKSLDIIGPGPKNVVISGNGTSRVFNISPGITTTVSGLTIRDGRTSNGISSSSILSAGGSAGPGGGLYNRGTLTLNACMFISNATGDGGHGTNGSNGVGDGGSGFPGSAGGPGGSGGGIYNEGILKMDRCFFLGNSTGNGGNGGNGGWGISGNYGGSGGSGASGTSGGYGGAIYNIGKLSMVSCTM